MVDRTSLHCLNYGTQTCPTLDRPRPLKWAWKWAWRSRFLLTSSLLLDLFSLNSIAVWGLSCLINFPKTLTYGSELELLIVSPEWWSLKTSLGKVENYPNTGKLKINPLYNRIRIHLFWKVEGTKKCLNCLYSQCCTGFLML